VVDVQRREALMLDKIGELVRERDRLRYRMQLARDLVTDWRDQRFLTERLADDLLLALT